MVRDIREAMSSTMTAPPDPLMLLSSVNEDTKALSLTKSSYVGVRDSLGDPDAVRR